MKKSIAIAVVLFMAVAAQAAAVQHEATSEQRQLSKLLALTQDGRATPADIEDIKKLAAKVLSQSDNVQSSFGQYDIAGCGSGPANWVKNEFANLKPDDSQVSSKFEALVDAYWLDPSHDWCSPDGSKGTGWGRKGLSYFEISMALMTYKRLVGLGVQFSDAQIKKLEAIWIDALRGAMNGSFYYFGPCNGFNGGTNIDDSCGEDDGSIARALSQGWNILPDATKSVLTDAETVALIKKFFDKFTSTDYTHGGDLMSDSEGSVWLPNHGGPSVVYSLIALFEAHEARMAFVQAGKIPPEFLKNGTLLSMFHWCQMHAYSDGSAFTSDCYRNSNPANTTLPCNDPGIADAVPTILAGGNYVDFLWGKEGFLPGEFRFTTCDLSLVGKAGNFDQGRGDEYCSWNPGRVDLKLLPVFTPPSFLDLRWIPPDNVGPVTFDVWSPDGPIARDIDGDSFSFDGVSCGAFDYTVYAVSGGLVVGADWGTTQIGCHIVRRHLKSLPITTEIKK